MKGLEGAVQSCISSLPSMDGAPEATVITKQLNKCCPLISQVSLPLLLMPLGLAYG